MSKKKALPIEELVDALDADAAISDIQSIIRHKGMSSTDLSIELGWNKAQVESFLYGVDIPKRSEFVQVAKVLDYELEF